MENDAWIFTCSNTENMYVRDSQQLKISNYLVFTRITCVGV